MAHPYETLPDRCFWKVGAASKTADEITDLWAPKFPVRKGENIVTFGSCFAQSFSKALVARGMSWLDAEPAPPFLEAEEALEYNYGVFSVRTGNIYTAASLRQWLSWAAGDEQAPQVSWEKDGRFYDPFRPAVEPEGFASHEELLEMREVTIAALRRAVEETGVFVFTMGLTEAWRDIEGGFVYAMCPGVIAGEFDATRHELVNFTYPDIFADMEAAFAILRRLNPQIKAMLTVSPVPLTATATGQHALVANTYTKNTLRSVAGGLSMAHDDVDYFPSYELVVAPHFGGKHYNPNNRTVRPEGVDLVMSAFFRSMEDRFGAGLFDGEAPAPKPETAAAIADDDDLDEDDDVVCEDQLLSAFR